MTWRKWQVWNRAVCQVVISRSLQGLQGGPSNISLKRGSKFYCLKVTFSVFGIYIRMDIIALAWIIFAASLVVCFYIMRHIYFINFPKLIFRLFSWCRSFLWRYKQVHLIIFTSWLISLAVVLGPTWKRSITNYCHYHFPCCCSLLRLPGPTWCISYKIQQFSFILLVLNYILCLLICLIFSRFTSFRLLLTSTAVF